MEAGVSISGGRCSALDHAWAAKVLSKGSMTEGGRV